MFPLPTAGRIGLYVLLLLAGVVALRLAEAVIVPLLVALLLVTVLGPAAMWLQEKLKIRWFLACITVVIALVLANLIIFIVFSSSVTSVVARMSNEEEIIKMYKKLRTNLEAVSPLKLDEDVFPSNVKKEAEIVAYYKDLREKVEKLPGVLKEEDFPRDPKNKLRTEEIIQKYKELRGRPELRGTKVEENVFPKELKSVQQIKLFEYVVNAAPYLLGQAGLYSANWAWQVILVLFTTFFVLLEGKMLAKRVVAIFGPAPEVQSKATEVLFEMADQVRTYLVWRTIINLGLAVVMGFVYQWLGLSQAWTWAIL